MLTVVGLVVLSDFGGFTTWYVRLILRLMQPVERILRQVPPWRQLFGIPVETRTKWLVIGARCLGAVFTFAGIGAIVTGL